MNKSYSVKKTHFIIITEKNCLNGHKYQVQFYNVLDSIFQMKQNFHSTVKKI